MSLTSILDTGNGGETIAQVAEAAGVDAATARRAMDALCPVIASQLQAKAKDDPGLVDDLAGLLEDNADAGIAGSEAMHDGNAMLSKLYGSQTEAKAALAPVVDGVSGAALLRLAAISVVAVIAAVNQQSEAMPLAGAQAAAGSGSSGILGTIIGAVITGAVQGAVRQLSAKRRRSTSNSTRKRKSTSHNKKTTTRKRRTTTRITARALEDILGGLFGTKR
jgi:hypothetical protein